MKYLKWFFLISSLVSIIIAVKPFSQKVYAVAGTGVGTTTLSGPILVNESLSIDEIRASVVSLATYIGVDPDRALFVLRHESQYCDWGRDGYYNPAITGDDGESIGCWQIYLKMHPEVTLDCASNFWCSTMWSLEQMKNGHLNWWSTWKYRKVWYPQDPID